MLASIRFTKCSVSLRGLLCCVVCCCAAVASARDDGADDLGQRIDYVRDVKPILVERCYACHGALKQEGGLRLDTVASMIEGGDSGVSLQPGRSMGSVLMDKIGSDDPSSRMPPEGKPLSSDQIAAISAWIDSGAVAPADDRPQADPRQHWSFQAPQRPPLLDVQDNARVARNPIDRLLAPKQEQLGLVPIPEADRRTLVRRLAIDLLGIPPRPEQVERFVQDDSPDAYEQLVDRLLAETAYGERWGRHWMDVWRYSDWYGRRSVPDVMNSYPQIWRWRDWIVRSLNEDKGYDRMVVEMLAADELTPADQSNVVATGFLVRNWYKWNYETWMKDNVEHTGKAFLGLTMNCAHCHDHKYDPITHEDYFRFRAFFEPLELRHDRVAGLPDPGPFKKYVYAESYGPIASGAIRVFDEKLDAATYMYRGGDKRNRIEGSEPLAPSPPTAFLTDAFSIEPVSLPVEAYYPGMQEFVRREEWDKVASEQAAARATLAKAESDLALAVSQVDAARHALAHPTPDQASPSSDAIVALERAILLARWDVKLAQAAVLVAQAKLSATQARISADDARFRQIGDAEALAKAAHRAEKQLAYEVAGHACLVAERAVVAAEHQAAVATSDKAEAAKQAVATAQQSLQAARTAIDAARVGLASNESSYTPFSPTYPATSTGRRTALARWIADRNNPLTARVAINHIWMRHFGQALVDTPDNFGIQGRAPLHPEVLDWLAVELMENNWSMKHIHRIIVTSQAYRRASNPSVDHPNWSIDRDNQSYWRRNPTRMEAEVVRDSVIACSGSLDPKIDGAEIDNAQWISTPRRSMYFTIHGESKMQFLDTFDGPNVCECYRRTSTVLPQQALAMTNSELLVHYGRKMAANMAREYRQSDPQQSWSDTQFVDRAFELVLSRQPSDRERELSLRFLENQRRILSEATPDQLSVASNKEVEPAAQDIEQRARENLAISLFSHNDFVTVR